MDDESGKDIREYVALVRRRRLEIIAIAALIAIAVAIVTIALPPVYRSSATIFVQEQEVPPDLVRSTITSFADERIQVISQQVMTRAVLLYLIDKYGLYDKDRNRVTRDDLVDRMRKDIKLTTVDANMSDRSSGRRVNATIAFQISYSSRRPERAQQVVNELVTLYLNENVRARQQSVAETTAFLAQEAERVAKQIQETETSLAEFKRRNMDRLPDSSAVNMQIAERTSSELQRVERDISTLQDRKSALELQLAAVKPYLTISVEGPVDRAATPEQRLRALQAQYANTSARYGPEHPDIRRLRREIAALESETGIVATKPIEAVDDEKALELELAALKERYGDNHPDVARVKRSLAALRTGAARAPATAAPAPKNDTDVASRPENPEYIALAAQVEAQGRDLKRLLAHRDELRVKLRAYDARLLQIPEIEREYRDLTRDYDNAQARYRDIKAKQMQAEVAQELEKDRKAERFSLGEPANLPEKPASPNRPLIAIVGFFASLGTGVGFAWIRDALDPSIKGPLELARIATVPLLTAIPYIETPWERIGRRRSRWLMILVAAVVVILLLVGIDLFIRPLPELASAIVRKIVLW